MYPSVNGGVEWYQFALAVPGSFRRDALGHRRLRERGHWYPRPPLRDLLQGTGFAMRRRLPMAGPPCMSISANDRADAEKVQRAGREGTTGRETVRRRTRKHRHLPCKVCGATLHYEFPELTGFVPVTTTMELLGDWSTDDQQKVLWKADCSAVQWYYFWSVALLCGRADVSQSYVSSLLLASYAERCQSGRMGWSRKPLNTFGVPRVRISPSPPILSSPSNIPA